MSGVLRARPQAGERHDPPLVGQAFVRALEKAGSPGDVLKSAASGTHHVRAGRAPQIHEGSRHTSESEIDCRDPIQINLESSTLEMIHRHARGHLHLDVLL